MVPRQVRGLIRYLFWLPLVAAVFLSIALPPRWFLDIRSMTLNRDTMEITMVRRTPFKNWVPVYAAWQPEAYFLSRPFRECKHPQGGGYDHYQFVPEIVIDGEIVQIPDTVRFYAHWMADCLNNHDTRLVVRHRIYLFGAIPLARKLDFETTFAGVPHDVPALKREVEELTREVEQLRRTAP